MSNGGKQVIYNALALNATLDEGDEVIVPAPYWPTFPDAVRINGGTPVIVETRAGDGFKLTPRALREAITPRTKWLILNSPANPSGAVYGADELAALAAVLREAPRVLVLWDEMYEEIWFEQPPAHLLRAAPDLAHRVLAVNGVSKAYAMTGWRIGWGVGPKPLVHALEAVQSQVSSGPSSVGQAAALAALEGAADGFVETARLAYARRAQRVVEGLGAIAGLRVHAPQGAFFAWIGVEDLIGAARPDGRRIADDGDLADWLLEAEGVAVVRGAAYGLSPYLRLSFAASDADIEAAIARLGRAVAALAPAGSDARRRRRPHDREPALRAWVAFFAAGPELRLRAGCGRTGRLRPRAAGDLAALRLTIPVSLLFGVDRRRPHQRPRLAGRAAAGLRGSHAQHAHAGAASIAPSWC